jgi:hypothetical protein
VAAKVPAMDKKKDKQVLYYFANKQNSGNNYYLVRPEIPSN